MTGDNVTITDPRDGTGCLATIDLADGRTVECVDPDPDHGGPTHVSADGERWANENRTINY